jgi:hypothetical protein
MVKPFLKAVFQLGAAHFLCSAGFQPAVSQGFQPADARNFENPGDTHTCRLEIGDTAGWNR